jgi:hypothetical protein
MATRIITANGVYDLSKVTNLADLDEEINFLKASIKKDEQDLEAHFRQLPRRMIKSTTDNLLPSFLNKLIANGTWKILVSGVAMFANPFSRKTSFTKNILGSAKRLGFLTLLKSAYSLWSKKGQATRKPAIPATGVTTLKTKAIK